MYGTSSLLFFSWLRSVFDRLSWLCRSKALDWDNLSLAKTLCMLLFTCRPETKNCSVDVFLTVLTCSAVFYVCVCFVLRTLMDMWKTWLHSFRPVSVRRPEFDAAAETRRCTPGSSPPAAAERCGYLLPLSWEPETSLCFLPSCSPASYTKMQAPCFCFFIIIWQHFLCY